MKPIVIVPSDVKDVAGHPMHCVGEKYLNAVSHGGNLMPLLLPAIGAGQDIDSLEQLIDLDQVLDLASGLFLTGSVSNVQPERYGGPADSEMKQDIQRDVTVFPLIEKALERGLPILAVCRGIQELNVAFGGTLHTAIQEVPGFNDHREPDGVPRAEMYGPAHQVEVCPGGILDSILDEHQFSVNSLHGQGIDEPGQSVFIEARSSDGVVEAISYPGQFVLGVQWHPEWAYSDNEQSSAIFAAFGKAAHQYANDKH